MITIQEFKLRLRKKLKRSKPPSKLRKTLRQQSGLKRTPNFKLKKTINKLILIKLKPLPWLKKKKRRKRIKNIEQPLKN